jgi:molecular chaperone GrpE
MRVKNIMSKKNDKQHNDADESIIEDDEFDYEPEVVEEQGMSDKLKKLRKELQETKKQSQEYLTGWQKERASFANFKAEEERKRAERITRLKLGLVSDFFPVLDSFDMAFGNKEAWESVDQNWRMGVEYIYTQFMNTLESYGIQVIPTEAGDAFNPNLHEPVETIDTDNPSDDGSIVKVVRKGYRTDETVLRPVKVQVARLSKKQENV